MPFCKAFHSQRKPEDSHRSSHWRERPFKITLEIKCDCDNVYQKKLFEK